MKSRLVLLCALLCAVGMPAQAEETAFTLGIKDRRFHPSELRIPAGVRIRLVVENQDEVLDEFDCYLLHREKHVPPHSRRTVFLGPLKPGRYPFKGEAREGERTAEGVLVVE